MITADFLITLAQIFHWLIQGYIIIIIIRSIMSWMGNLPPHPLVQLLRRLTDPVFRLVYRVLPHHVLIVGNIDISPIIIVIALSLVDMFVTGLLTDLARQVGRI
ncbi:MAG: YggT family protein [Candidatus Aminicenantes bacterium]|nr:YggT family protein [Candidatus Aminicenantes bacterium]